MYVYYDAQRNKQNVIRKTVQKKNIVTYIIITGVVRCADDDERRTAHTDDDTDKRNRVNYSKL